MENFSPITASLGGAMIGLAAVWLMASYGRIAGISGILGGIFENNNNDKFWRFSFFLGLLVSPHLVSLFDVSLLNIEFPVEGPLLITAAILVGIGTQLGNGCTSGHGVCGNALLSQRSIVATLTFMITGIITVVITKFLGGV
jgi:uncharacterized membrane protein YedE/YeeE